MSSGADLTTPYKPVATYFKDADILEFIEADVPFISRFQTRCLDMLLDLETRQQIGFRIHGWSKIMPASPVPPTVELKPSPEAHAVIRELTEASAAGMDIGRLPVGSPVPPSTDEARERLRVQVRSDLEEMANRCSAPMDLWDRFSNGVLALLGDTHD